MRLPGEVGGEFGVRLVDGRGQWQLQHNVGDGVGSVHVVVLGVLAHPASMRSVLAASVFDGRSCVSAISVDCCGGVSAFHASSVLMSEANSDQRWCGL